MSKLVVVQNDAVQGTDTHNITGQTAVPSAYTGTGRFVYTGKMTDALSSFVTINGVPVALVTSKSSLNPGESAPGGGHNGTNAQPPFVPPAPPPVVGPTLSITDPIGTGVPNAAAGSQVLTVNGVKVLLDGDKIDTCDGLSSPANSTVTASGQSFVTSV